MAKPIIAKSIVIAEQPKKKVLLTTLTKEQEDVIPEWIRKYSAPVFDGSYNKNFHFENAEKLIDWQYAKAPKRIHRNATGFLHNPNGYAVEWEDGWECYYINGRNIPKEVYEKAATLTKEEFLSERNSDHKGAWYEILGQKKMLDLLGAAEVDTQTIVHANGDLETVTLLKTMERFEEIGGQPFAWVKMVCPSTATQYLQGVEPHHTNAKEAIASLSKLKASEYSFHFRS